MSRKTRKTVKVLVELSVAPGITAGQARREVRTRVNELCAAEFYDGPGTGISPANVRVRRMGPLPSVGTVLVNPTNRPVMFTDQLAELPAIKALAEYAATAPAEKTDEGYWDNMEAANSDGQRQESSEAAWVIRHALRALGIDPPTGLPVCKSCGGQSGEDGWHYHDCDIADCPPEMEATDANA